MKNKKRKIVSIIVLSLVLLSFNLPVFASENIDTEVAKAQVDELWENALSQGGPVYTMEELENLPTPFVYQRIDGSWSEWTTNGYTQFGVFLICDNNGSTFNSVSQFGLYSPDRVTFSDFDYTITLIDSRRTAAVNFSATATITSDWGATTTKPISKYVEFYAGSSNCTVY